MSRWRADAGSKSDAARAEAGGPRQADLVVSGQLLARRYRPSPDGPRRVPDLAAPASSFNMRMHDE